MAVTQHPSALSRIIEGSGLSSSPNDKPPSMRRMFVASLCAVLLSLGANWALARLGMQVSSLRHYAHFRFVDYGTLTIIGVGAACVAWYVTTRICERPRWLFFRMAIAVSVLLFAPDVWLLAKGEPSGGVGILAAMHLTIALITYNVLVHVAEVVAPTLTNGSRTPDSSVEGFDGTSRAASAVLPVVSRRAWSAMMLLTLLEMLLGFGEMLSVSFDRPNGFVITQGEAITLVHGALGSVLGFAGLVILSLAWRQGRIERVAAIVGLIGLGVGGLGGLLCYAHSLRLIGMVIMFLGASTAFFGYLMPTIDDAPHPAPSQIR